MIIDFVTIFIVCVYIVAKICMYYSLYIYTDIHETIRYIFLIDIYKNTYTLTLCTILFVDTLADKHIINIRMVTNFIKKLQNLNFCYLRD